MRFGSFLSGGLITAIVVNPPERKLSKRTSVQCTETEEGYQIVSPYLDYLTKKMYQKLDSIF